MWPFSRRRADWNETLPTDFPSYDAWWNTLGRYQGAPYEPPSSLDDATPVGLSYDNWWLTIGRDSGIPYNPTPPPPAPVHVIEPNGVILFMPDLERDPSARRMHEIGRAIFEPHTAVSGFFYDKDLAKFGNAVSPFVEMDARDAHLAEQRRFEDRYDPKYFVDYDQGMDAIAQLVEQYEMGDSPPCRPARACWQAGYNASRARRAQDGGLFAIDPNDPMPNMLAWDDPRQPRLGDTFVGWAQPPHPIDVVPSFNPTAGSREQARAVLMDYYHDDALRYWADNEAVKRCFGVKNKEDYDPALLVEAYENPKHKVWGCKGDKNTWKDLDDAVKKAIAHRSKLGPLPKSNYGEGGADPIVIYYYDNDKMKRITYPRASIPAALNPSNVWWWKWGQGPGDDASKKKGLDDVHTNETDDPKKIAAERSKPGYPGGGDWGSEGVTWDKDMIGVVAPIVGAVLAIVSAVLDMTGVGTLAGIALGIATPFITAAIAAADTALHAGDFGAALQNLGPALLAATGNALSKSGVQIPPEAMKALGTTVTAIGKAVSANQKQLDFGDLWDKIAKKAGGYTKIGDAEAHAIAVMLGENAAGNVFIHGYEAGKLTDAKTVAAIAKIMEAMKQFSDPAIINIFLLGAGIGYLGKTQAAQAPAAKVAPTSRLKKRRVKHPATPAAHLTQGDFIVGLDSAQERLHTFVTQHLAPRYGLSRQPRTFAGFAVGAPTSDPMIVAIQMLLNELWGFVVGSVQYIRPTGVLTPRTKELLQGFQQSYNVPPGDGTPNLDTIRALEAAVDDKRQLLQHWAAEHAPHATSGAFVGAQPDWSALARGCPHGYWWDSLSGQCRPLQPPPHAVEGEALTHFYTPKSEGAMLDLVFAFQNAGIPMTGDMPKWTARLGGVLFAIVWDGPDESVRVAILDHGRANLAAFWNHVDAVMAR